MPDEVNAKLDRISPSESTVDQHLLTRQQRCTCPGNQRSLTSAVPIIILHRANTKTVSLAARKNRVMGRPGATVGSFCLRYFFDRDAVLSCVRLRPKQVLGEDGSPNHPLGVCAWADAT
jgi:hypothetical protein